MTSSICYLGWIHYDFHNIDWFQEKDALSFYSLLFFRYFHFKQRKLEVIYLIASLIIYLKPQRRFQIRILLNQSDKVITFGQLINFCYQLILSNRYL